ncbi:hypothetical protein IDZ49_10540 [Francisella tularensis]|nr:hypothetical protein [Francisella tularensis]
MSYTTMLHVAANEKPLIPHIKLPMSIHASLVTIKISSESIKTSHRITKILV